MEKEIFQKKLSVAVLENANFEALSDKDLYVLCKEYGGRARLWARKFAFLLPEVARRRLHRKKGFESIYEFAGRLGGMSREVAYRVLNLHAKLKGMPKLWGLLKSQGWGKLKLITTIATPETEDYWVDKVNTMARSTLQLFIQGLKKQDSLPGHVKAPTLFGNFGTIEKDESDSYVYNKPKIAWAPNFCTENSVTGTEKILTEIANDSYESPTNVSKLRTFRKLKFQVDGATEIDFRVFKSELEKVRKEAMTMGEALRALLEIVKLAKMLSKCMPKEYRALFPYWKN